MALSLLAAGEQRYAAIDEPDTGEGRFGTGAIQLATHDAGFDNARLPLAQRFRPRRGRAQPPARAGSCVRTTRDARSVRAPRYGGAAR